MVIKYVIWQVQRTELPQTADKKEFEKSLIKSSDKSEIARFLYLEDAEDYLAGRSGTIIPSGDKAYAEGYTLKSYEVDRDGKLHHIKDKNFKTVKVCELKDMRYKKDYFKEGPAKNDDYCDYTINRPGSLKEANAYDMEFINYLLNKDTLDEEDKANIAHVMHSLIYNYESMNESFCDMENAVINKIGHKEYEEICNDFIGEKMKRFTAKILEGEE